MSESLREKTCCFTGHRVIPARSLPALAKELEQTLRRLIGADVRRYRDILRRADKVVYTAERYSPGCMHRRNRHLVENSSVCVAYCTRETGGSAYTAQYARQRGLRLVLLGAGERPPSCAGGPSSL